MIPGSDAEASSREPSTGALLQAGLVLLITLVALEAMSVATVMPLVEDDLGDLALYGWTFSAFFLGGLVGVVVASSAADRMAPWIPIAGSVVVFAAGLSVAGLAPSMLVLVAGRALQGLGAGALPAVAFVCVGRSVPEHRRPRVLALMSSAWMIPSVVGPLLAAWVGEAIGWRWVFLGLLPLCVVIGPLVVLGVRSVPAPVDSSSPRNISGALLVALGAGILLVGLGAGRWWLVTPGVALGLCVLVPAFRRLTPPGTLRAAVGLPATVASRGLLGMAYHAVDAYVPFAVTTVRGAAPLMGGLALLTASATWTVASWTQVRLVPVLGPVRLVRVGFVLMAVGSVLMLAVLLPSVPVVLALVAWGIGGFGIGLAWAPITQTGLGAAVHGQEGRVTTSLQLADMLGIAIGTGAAGAVLAALTESTGRDAPGVAVAFSAGAVISVLGAIVAVRMRPRAPVAVETELAGRGAH